MRIYVSSTFKDLEEHRQAVIGQIRRLEYTAVCMEDYGAGDERAAPKCLDDVASCDIYVGIIAWRYGYVDEEYPESEGRSITELEYRKALEVGIPTLMFLVDEDYSWPPKHIEKGEGAEKLEALKAEVAKDKMVDFFTTPEDLGANAGTAITKAAEKVKPKQAATEEMMQAFMELQKATLEKLAQAEADKERLRHEAEQAAKRREESRRERIVGGVRSTVIDHFQDRVSELQALRDRVADADLRLVLVCGRGGMGKTALVTKLIHEVKQNFGKPPGEDEPGVESVVFVQLKRSDCRSSDHIVDLISRTLDEETREELQGRWQNKTSLAAGLEYLFQRALSDQRRLIVLDNFEDVLGEDNHIRKEYHDLEEFIEASIEYDHDALLMVTSRRPLKLSGDLEVRAGTRRKEVRLDKGLPNDAAIELLRDLDEDGGRGIKDAPEEVLAQVADRCKGMPRILEAVVGWLSSDPMRTLETLLSDEEAFERLVEETASELYNGLPSDAHRLALQVLSIYEGGVPAAAVTDLLPGLPAEDVLAGLVRDHVVSRDRDRFSLHPLDQEYAYAQIPDEGDEYSKKALHKRAAEFFKDLRTPADEWKTIQDLDPQLQQFHHLVQAELYDAAAEVLSTIAYNYLEVWGYYDRLIRDREQLVGKLRDPRLERNNRGHLGMHYTYVGRAQEGIRCVEQTLQACRDSGDAGGVRVWVGNLAVLYGDVGERQKAIECYDEAVTSAREMRDRAGESAPLGNLGFQYTFIGEDRRAVEYCQRALDLTAAIFSSRTRLRRQGVHRDSLAVAFANLGDSEKALEHAEQAIAIFREINYRRAEGMELNVLALVHSDMDQVEEAIRLYKEALEIGESIHYPEIISGAHEGLGRAYHGLGRLEEARPRYEEGIELAMPLTCYSCEVGLGVLSLEERKEEEARDHLSRGIGLCEEMLDKSPNLVGQLYKLALAQLAIGQTKDALATYQRAVVVGAGKGLVKRGLQDLTSLERAAPSTEGLQEAGQCLNTAIEQAPTEDDRRSQSSELNQLALDFLTRGNLRAAREHFERALQIDRDLGNKASEAAVLGNLGLSHIFLGEPREALELSTQSMELDRRQGRRRSEGVQLGNVALEHWMLGDTEKALQMNIAALAIANEVNNHKFQGLHQGNIARAQTELGNMLAAEQYFLAAIDIARDTKNTVHECQNLAALGGAYANMGDLERADSRIAEGLQIASDMDYPRGQGRALHHQGWQRIVAGDIEGAVESYKLSRDVMRKCQDKFFLSRALVGLTRAQHHAGETEVASRTAEEALELDMQYNTYACAVRLGLLSLQAGEGEAAQAHFAQGITLCEAQLERADKFWDAVYHLALAQLCSGQAEEAIATYQRALEVCSAKGIVTVALADLRLLEAQERPPEGLAQAAGVLAEVVG